MTQDDAEEFARRWIAAWNARDIEAVLAHYAEAIVFFSPLAEAIAGSGRVEGKAALRRYWQAALAARPDLRFELLGAFVGSDALTLRYRNQRGQEAAETMEFAADGKIIRAYACYAAASVA